MKRMIGFVLLSVVILTASGQENVITGEKKKTDAVKSEVKKTQSHNAGEVSREVKSSEITFEKMMTDGKVQACFGQFFDSGGPNGSYKGNEDYTYTIESESEGAYLILRFVEFFLSEGDELTVYDGSSTDAKIIGTYSNSNKIPFEIKSSGNSLTFYFRSDATGNASGWRASIACYEGSRKILKTDGMTPSARVVYVIDGIKDGNDVLAIEDILRANDYIQNVEFDKSSSLFTVYMTDESYKDLIVEQIKSSREITGHELSVRIKEIIPAKPTIY
jgi:hypothetical protein